MAKAVADQFAEILTAVSAKRICVGDNLNRFERRDCLPNKLRALSARLKGQIVDALRDKRNVE